MVKNQTSKVKNDSLVSGPGSEEPGGLRRSVRDKTKNKSGSSSSPMSVRKSQRLETPRKKDEGSAEKSPGANCGSGGRFSEKDVNGQRNNSDNEEVKEHANENVDGDEDVSGSDVNIESNRRVSNEVSSDSDVARCDLKGSPVAQSEGIHTSTGNFVSSALSGCYRNLFTDPCDICLRKKRLDYSSSEEGLCCCLQNIINNVDMSSLVEDRGESEIIPSQSAEKHDQDIQLRDSSADVDHETRVLCKRGGKLVYCGGRDCRRSYHPPCLLIPKTVSSRFGALGKCRYPLLKEKRSRNSILSNIKV